MMLTCLTVHGVEHYIKSFSWHQGVQGLSEMMDGSKIWMSNKNMPLLCPLLQCLAIPYE